MDIKDRKLNSKLNRKEFKTIKKELDALYERMQKPEVMEATTRALDLNNTPLNKKPT